MGSMTIMLAMVRLAWALLVLPWQVLASDHGVLLFGGEGPDGPVDTVSVLTEQGWCPQDHVLLPSLPMAASGLAAYHGYETEQGRPFIAVCGFPGDHPCYYTTLTNPVWLPMGLYDEDINLAELEFVTMFANYMGGGLKSMWRNKTSGNYDWLWAPGAAEDGGGMVGWLRQSTPDSVEGGALGSDPGLACVAQPEFSSDGYPLMTTISGGFDTDHSLDMLIIDDAHVDDDNPFHEWKDNSIGLGQPRSGHSCRKFEMLGTGGVLLAGGFSLESGSSTPTNLDTMEFMFPDPGAHSDIANTFRGFQPMQQPRAGFGLADWGEDGLVAIGGKVYTAWPDYTLLDSVEVWDKVEDLWVVREEWRLVNPLAGFGVVSKGRYDSNEVHGSDYCSA